MSYISAEEYHWLLKQLENVKSYASCGHVCTLQGQAVELASMLDAIIIM
ncbi:MAG: hypothetical protein PW786_04935 [Arachidicoccus sp.]|nr:hypothetical protein [Arachidicoccus sp.]